MIGVHVSYINYYTNRVLACNKATPMCLLKIGMEIVHPRLHALRDGRQDCGDKNLYENSPASL